MEKRKTRKNNIVSHLLAQRLLALASGPWKDQGPLVFSANFSLIARSIDMGSLSFRLPVCLAGTGRRNDKEPEEEFFNLRFPVVLPQGFLIPLSLIGEGRGEVK